MRKKVKYFTLEDLNAFSQKYCVDMTPNLEIDKEECFFPEFIMTVKELPDGSFNLHAIRNDKDFTVKATEIKELFRLAEAKALEIALKYSLSYYIFAYIVHVLQRNSKLFEAKIDEEYFNSFLIQFEKTSIIFDARERELSIVQKWRKKTYTLKTENDVAAKVLSQLLR